VLLVASTVAAASIEAVAEEVLRNATTTHDARGRELANGGMRACNMVRMTSSAPPYSTLCTIILCPFAAAEADRQESRQGRRGVAISSRAKALVWFGRAGCSFLE
jgi:hypothetical protein